MTEKKIIYNGFYHQYKLPIIEHLNRKYNWKPILTSGIRLNSNHINFINNKYPSCIVTDSNQLRNAQFNYKLFNKETPIDAEILNSLSNYAFNFLGILRDTTGHNFSYDERRSYYYDILKYWNTVIYNLKPDLFISYVFPHTPSCVSLYLLCKHYYKIDTLFVDPNPLFDKEFHIIGTSLEKLYEPILKHYNSNEILNPGHISKEFLKSLKKKKTEKPKYILENHLKLKETSTISHRIKQFGSILYKTLQNNYGFKYCDWKKNTKPYDDVTSKMNRFEEFFFIERLRNQNKKLKEIYNRFVKDVDYSVKYIYFASQYQPEASTSQTGSYYENFFLALDILSAAIPNDWVIYYKENSTIFSNSFMSYGSLKRSKYYYEKLSKYRNIKMVSTDTNTFDMIDNAKAVSTITGTVAIEATARGIPAITFGSIWYGGCKSIFSIKTFDDAKVAIEKILKGYKPDTNDLEHYLASVEKIASNKIIPQRIFEKEINKSENPENISIDMAEAFYEAYIKNYSQ